MSEPDAASCSEIKGHPSSVLRSMNPRRDAGTLAKTEGGEAATQPFALADNAQGPTGPLSNQQSDGDVVASALARKPPARRHNGPMQAIRFPGTIRRVATPA